MNTRVKAAAIITAFYAAYEFALFQITQHILEVGMTDANVSLRLGSPLSIFTAPFANATIDHLSGNLQMMTVLTAAALVLLWIQPSLGNRKHFVLLMVAGPTSCGIAASSLYYVSVLARFGWPSGGAGTSIVDAAFDALLAMLALYALRSLRMERKSRRFEISIYLTVFLWAALYLVFFYGQGFNYAHFYGMLIGLSVGWLYVNQSSPLRPERE